MPGGHARGVQAGRQQRREFSDELRKGPPHMILIIRVAKRRINTPGHPSHPRHHDPSLFQFGEKLPEYDIPVLNERAERANAGSVLFAIVSFMNAWLTGNFQPTRVFVVVFLLDFTIRSLINPGVPRA